MIPEATRESFNSLGYQIFKNKESSGLFSNPSDNPLLPKLKMRASGLPKALCTWNDISNQYGLVIK